MYVAKKITIDLNRPRKEVVHLGQGDSFTRWIELTLLCDGVPYDPTADLSALGIQDGSDADIIKTVKYIKANGISGEYENIPEDGTTPAVALMDGETNVYIVRLDEHATDVPGFAEVFVTFYVEDSDGNMHVLHSFPVTLDVVQILTGDTDPGQPYYNGTPFLLKSKQATKTVAMTQSVGVDSNGKLWTTPGGSGSNRLVVTLNSSGVPDVSSGDIYSAWQAGYIITLRSSIGIEYDLQHCDAQKATFSTTINGATAVIVDGYNIEGSTATHYVLNGYVKPQGGIPETDMTVAVQAALAAAVPTVVTLTGSTPVIAEAQDNTIYEAGELTSLTIQSVATGASFIVRFSSPAGTATVLTMPSGVYMPSGFSVEPYGRCEINVDGNYALAAFWPFDE